MTADVDQLWSDDAGSAVQGRESFVQLRHAAANTELSIDQVDRKASIGDIQCGLHPGDAGTDDKGGSFFRLSHSRNLAQAGVCEPRPFRVVQSHLVLFIFYSIRKDHLWHQPISRYFSGRRPKSDIETALPVGRASEGISIFLGLAWTALPTLFSALRGKFADGVLRSR